MGSLGGNGGSIWGLGPFHSHNQSRRRNKRSRESKPSESVDSTSTDGAGFRFPLKQAVTAASLSLTGDTIAQLRQRWVKNQNTTISDSQDMMGTLLTDHDWLRAVRMTSYGFLFYGPGSYAWYQFLDRCMPKQTMQTIWTKVLLNQVILGPAVIAVVFAWNNLWLGKISELPNKYRKDALSTLLFGFRFWIPVSILNFWIIPLQARVAFMSTNSIFWNFYLSSTMSK